MMVARERALARGAKAVELTSRHPTRKGLAPRVHSFSAVAVLRGKRIEGVAPLTLP
jgi:hypothetical protein